jgi:hypothetical protein
MKQLYFVLFYTEYAVWGYINHYILRTNYNAKNADFKLLPLLSVSKCSQFSSVNQVNGRLLKTNMREKTMIFDEDYFKKIHYMLFIYLRCAVCKGIICDRGQFWIVSPTVSFKVQPIFFGKVSNWMVAWK